MPVAAITSITPEPNWFGWVFLCFICLPVCTLSAQYGLSLFETHSVRTVPNLLVIGLHGFTGRLQAAAMGACGGCVRMGIFDESSPTLMVQQVWAVWY